MRIFFAILTSIALLGCQNFGATEKGALAGSALGAGLGAIVGHETGNTGAGVAIGTAAGALAGGLLGKRQDDFDRDIKQRQDKLDSQEQQLAENRKLIQELRARGADVRSTSRGVVVNLPDVLFEFDSARITTAARRTVGQIASVINDTPGRRIMVEGHTDSVGTIAYNQRLSEGRAGSVARELISEGVKRSRVVSRGYGESSPIASNTTDSGRARNRRVEVIIENR